MIKSFAFAILEIDKSIIHANDGTGAAQILWPSKSSVTKPFVLW